MMNKKAFEVQFNWIFVLVAGAMILLFFTVIVVKQKNVAETSTKATVLKSIEAIITGAGVSRDTTNRIDLPSSSIEIGCNRISTGAVSKQFQDLVIFAPGTVKGDKLLTQTIAFSAPYRATNLLYLTSLNARYVIIGDSQLAREVNKSLPQELKKEFYPALSQLRNTNDYRVRFIVFGGMIQVPQSLSKMADSDVTALRVEGDLSKGKVEFYEKKGNSWDLKGNHPYMGMGMILGAVYSDRQELYECSMKEALSRLRLVTNVHSQRTQKLLQSASSTGNARCNQIYSSALDRLNGIMAASSGFSESSINVISAESLQLSQLNSQAKQNSCPLVY